MTPEEFEYQLKAGEEERQLEEKPMRMKIRGKMPRRNTNRRPMQRRQSSY